MSSRLCTICLNSVVDDNSRGKAELVCGHLFHLDCIGSEFNYRSEMKCPNCRVVESGEWLFPEVELDDDEDYSVGERRLEIHIYSHGGRGDSSTSRDQIGSQDLRLPMIAPTVHYHHNTVVFPSNYEGNTSAVYGNDSLNADALLRTYGSPQGSNSTRQTRVDRVVMQDTSISRPNAGEVRAVYHRTRFRNNFPSSTIVDSELIHQRREENSVHTNTTAYESYGDPSLELSLTTNSSEERSQEEQH